MFLPKSEGISDVRTIHGDELSGPPLKQLKDGHSLSDLTADYELFTYAPLFLYGGLEHNIIQEWININKHPQIVYILKLDKPLFNMNSIPLWDRTVWAVVKEHYPSLVTHISSIGLVDRKAQTFSRVFHQRVPVTDALSKFPNTKLRIHAFCVDSNKGCIVFKNAKPYPSLIYLPPLPATVILANALFTDKENPYNTIGN